MDRLELDALKGLFEQYPIKKYKKGNLILSEGDPIYEIGFIKSGFIRLYKHTLKGEEFTINFFKPLFIVTLMYSYLDKNCEYNLEAVTDVEIWRAPKEEIIKELIANLKFGDLMARKYMNLLRAALNGMGNLMTGDAENKIGVAILALANQYGEPKCDGHKCKNTEIPFELTQRVLASIAGTTRETANKVINNLEKENLLKREGKRIVITNICKLKDYLEK